MSEAPCPSSTNSTLYSLTITTQPKYNLIGLVISSKIINKVKNQKHISLIY